MGSVAAVLSRSGAPDEGAVRRMLAAAPHRGSRVSAIVHGAAALAVSDAQERSEGSLAAREGWAAAFTGALDNAAELAAELGLEASAAVGIAPADLMILAFRTWGDGAPDRLRGAFASVVTDGARLWCFRDHVGSRSLFFRDDHRGFYAATEAKQVVAGAGIAKEPDLEVVEAIFYREYDDETPAALKGVRRLPKATVMVVEGTGGFRCRRYWTPERLLETARITGGELKERFDELMTQAVARALTGNDAVALSGGIDSPAVAAFAAPLHRERTGRPLTAVSAVYPDHPSVDESEYIELMADFLEIPLVTYTRRVGLMEGLQDWIRVMDGPVPDLMANDAAEHYRHVREAGCSSMLTGEIAEAVSDMRRYLLSHLLLHGRLGPLWHHAQGQRAKGVPVSSIGVQLLSVFVPRPLAVLNARLRPPRGAARTPEWVDARRARRARALDVAAARDRWKHEQMLPLEGPGLGMEADEIWQELAGVRKRRPWADVDLWEFFFSLPADVKFPNTTRKGLLRSLLRGRVPDAILDRRDKTVFGESAMARIDYAELRKWLATPDHRIAGVRYDLLAERLEREDLDLVGLTWARDLASVHAFLALW